MSPADGPCDPSRMARREGAARARSEPEATARLAELLGIVWRLRDPDGCPWDREQTVESMISHLAEEASELADAVAGGDDQAMAEELGDTLMNVLLTARIAEQDGRFDLAQTASAIAAKLVRRHPHVFGDRQADTVQAALASWNEAKQAEPGPERGTLGGVPSSLSALLAALRVGQKAAGAGFDWPGVSGALAKLEEELGELREALDQGAPAAVEDELGDVLFSAVNVARKAGIDPDLALRRTIAKFRRRFASMERALGPRLAEASLEEMERHWLAAAWEEPPPAS